MRIKAGAAGGAISQAASSRRFLLYLSITLVAAVFVLVTQNLGYGIGRELSSSSFVRPERRASSEQEKVLMEPKSSSKSQTDARLIIISGVIAFPDDEFLVLLSGDDHGNLKDSSRLKGSCAFAFGDQEQPQEAKIVGAGFQSQGRVSIRCRRIDNKINRKLAAESFSADSSSSVTVQLQIEIEEPARTIIIHGAQLQLLWWNRLVFDAAVDDSTGDLVLFTKGIFKKELETQPEGASCVFFSQEGAQIAETEIVGLAQELVRCKQPAGIKQGDKISIIYSKNSTPVPSVAIYDSSAPSETKQRHLVCACTMIYNGAKFLREWIEYHSHLGIDKFFLYDNNSEDGLEQSVALLNSDGLGTAAVERRLWPWIKTQEAGFSHCALTARRECEWMAFVDVDEFLFPKNWLEQEEQQNSAPESGRSPFAVDDSPILARVIQDVQTRRIPPRNTTADAATRVGQISFHCRDFGPSGLTRHPESGVTQGYTCRVGKEQRHKSLVKLDALDPSLINVIHHFDLSPGYSTAKIPAWKGVVNHYKYQAWDEFKNKFKRRVSAYVVDWTENKNINSQDRTPGLGYRAVKPANWERQFCEVEDTALRDYVLKIFKPRWTSSLPWQVQ